MYCKYLGQQKVVDSFLQVNRALIFPLLMEADLFSQGHLNLISADSTFLKTTSIILSRFVHLNFIGYSKTLNLSK